MAGKGSALVNVLSVLYLGAAVWLLVCVCSQCNPALSSAVRRTILGWEESPVREAFSVVADELEAGEAVKEAFVSGFEVLIGEAD